MPSPTSTKAGQKSWKWRDAFLRNKTDVLNTALSGQMMDILDMSIQSKQKFFLRIHLSPLYGYELGLTY